jgi:hypothetical protein
MNDEIKQKWNICLEEERRIAETTAIPIGYDLIEQAAIRLWRTRCQVKDCKRKADHMLCDTHLQAFPIIYKLTHDEATIRADERRKMQNEPINTIMQGLPIISMISTVAMIPQSNRRKNAVMKMVAIEFKKQIAEARASEREEMIWTCASCNNKKSGLKDKHCSTCLEKTRADERRKHNYDKPTIEEIARLEKEAYAKGKAEAHSEMYEMGLKDGEKLGQANLIEILRVRFNELDKQGRYIDESDLENVIMVLASESASEKETKQEADASFSPKPSVLAKPENALTPTTKEYESAFKHIFSKPEKPLCDSMKGEYHEGEVWLCGDCGEVHSWETKPEKKVKR